MLVLKIRFCPRNLPARRPRRPILRPADDGFPTKKYSRPPFPSLGIAFNTAPVGLPDCKKMLLPALARELAGNVKDLNVFKRLFDFGGFIIAKNESCLSSFFAALAVGRMRSIAPVASWPHSEAAGRSPGCPHTHIYNKECGGVGRARKRSVGGRGRGGAWLGA